METYLQLTFLFLLLACFVVQLYFLIVFHQSLGKCQANEALPMVNIPVSVIISARNEAANLKENLPYILAQNYPDFEVVVINDCSSDASELVLEDYQKSHSSLKVVTITEHPRFKTGKKFALSLGIKAAKNEFLLFTDADCRPASENWISRMAVNFARPAQIILGYSPMYATNNFLNPLVRFETIKTAINYLSMAIKGDPYMGIGRNLAYTKTLFFGVKGFAAHMHVLSGDDDLFVNQNATANNTAVEIHPDAFMYTPAKTTLRGLYRQKKRHMGVGKYYKSSHRRWLSLDAVTGLLFYILLILCIVFNFWPLAAIGLFVLRLAAQLIIYKKIFKKLGASSLFWYLPILDFVYYVYLNIFGLIGTFIKTTKWK